MHWINTEEEAREAVRTEAARNVDLIKLWVDDRDGQYEQLTPELYGPAIDEAHQLGLRVSAHIFDLADAKGLLRADVDIFAHGVRIRMSMMNHGAARRQPDTVLIPNMAARGVAPIRAGWPVHLPKRRLPTEPPRQSGPQESPRIQAGNLARRARPA